MVEVGTGPQLGKSNSRVFSGTIRLNSAGLLSTPTLLYLRADARAHLSAPSSISLSLGNWVSGTRGRI